jgi:uncharacterized protein (TIGR02145 family)
LPQDNQIIEKWCYDNDESNCETSGAMYSWYELMQYSTSENAQGICPTGYHVPSDAQWTTLIEYAAGSP